MNPARINLFIYGSLRDRKIFQSVCGFTFTVRPSRIADKTLFAEPCFLSGYRRVSPDNVYFYAVADKSARIEGLMIHDVPVSAMASIDWYEGKRYRRETATVHTASGPAEAQAYLVTRESMRRYFGDRFHVNLIHELWLRKRIEKFIERHTRPGERTVDAKLERLADRVLLATTERDLVMSHYQSDAVSDYYLARELDRPRPSIRYLCDDPEAQPFLGNYLTLVVRQVLLDQLEEQIQAHYRFELDHMRASERYFARSISLLVALRMINRNRSAVDLVVQQCLTDLNLREHDLIGYVKYAVRASRSLFHRRIVESHLDRIASSRQPGLIPLGFEMEMSNLGPAAVEPLRTEWNAYDRIYNGFKYFYDFRLDLLSWKLGGYVDDHTGSIDGTRRMGFLEVAPGRLNIAGELSRPATSDPWLLNSLVHELISFYDVRPHSLHLSFQLRKNQIGTQKLLPLGFVKCLLALGGGPEFKGTGGLWVSRMGRDEIRQYALGEELVFARTSRRNWYLGGDDIGNRTPSQATTHVQQYKFIRLEERANYEPLILCLKGLQMEYNPGDYLRAEQLQSSPYLRRKYVELKRWSVNPTPIGPQTITRFLQTVHRGLMNEGHRRPAHKLHYIDWAMSAIDIQLRLFNQQIKKAFRLR